MNYAIRMAEDILESMKDINKRLMELRKQIEKDKNELKEIEK